MDGQSTTDKFFCWWIGIVCQCQCECECECYEQIVWFSAKKNNIDKNEMNDILMIFIQWTYDDSTTSPTNHSQHKLNKWIGATVKFLTVICVDVFSFVGVPKIIWLCSIANQKQQQYSNNQWINGKCECIKPHTNSHKSNEMKGNNSNPKINEMISMN